jgi:hypothetical protein
MAVKMIRKLTRAGRHMGFTWRYLFNLAPTLSYQFSRDSISGEAARVLRELNRNGVAVSSAKALFEEASCYNELCESVDSLGKSSAGQLESARRAANEPGPAEHKSFIFPLLGDYPLFDPDGVFARFALQKPILQIANAYLGMYTRLRYYNVWHTFASRSDARQSQLWHRDREDLYIFKVFVYLSDIDEGAGPFTYARGSHPKGRLRRQPGYFLEGNVKRSSDEHMQEAVPKDEWLSCVGQKGTIIFADTQGYHKGGLARERDRLMYTCMFTSPASQSEEFFRRTAPVARPATKELAFALAGPRPGPWLSTRL